MTECVPRPPRVSSALGLATGTAPRQRKVWPSRPANAGSMDSALAHG